MSEPGRLHTHSKKSLRLPKKAQQRVTCARPGRARVAQVLREALARGADRAIHVEHDALAGADAFVVADALSGAR